MRIDYNVALSGIRAAEHLIATAQNNISNAHNSSYARQRVDLSAVHYNGGGSGIQGQMGRGVNVDQIKRISDNLMIQQSRSEKSKLTGSEAMSELLKSIEVSFGEMGESSISGLTQDLFNSFEEASKYPEQSSYRVGVIGAATMLSNKIQEVSKKMDGVKSEADSRIDTEVDRVNSLINEISKSNEKLLSTSNENPNSLLDERDRLLDELSSLIDIEVVQKGRHGEIEVVTGTSTLVSGDKSFEINKKFDAENDEWVLGVNNVELELQSGSIKSLLDVRNKKIPEYTNKFTEFTTNLGNEMNKIHKSGYGLDGTSNLELFTNINPRTFEVNQELAKDPKKLGLSSEAGVAGNSDIALEMSELQFEKVLEGDTIQGFYQEFSVDMANDLKNSNSNVEVYKNLHNAIEGNRQSVQGVDVDEELLAINSYQQYYQANARSLKIIDSLLDDVLSLI